MSRLLDRPLLWPGIFDDGRGTLSWRCTDQESRRPPMFGAPMSRFGLAGKARWHNRTNRRFHCALGVLAAGLLFELCLRPFVADSTDPGGIPSRTIRNYAEGLAVAHFEVDGLGQLGNRVTGNPRLSGAPEGLIVGDSHVVAYSVRDRDTMGAVVERLSRESGHPLNVRQYGWPGANAPTFLAAADSLLGNRNPAWVAVVLNSYNIGVNTLTTSRDWRMEVAPDYTVRLIHVLYQPRTSWREMLLQWTARSSLALAIWRRQGLIWGRLALEHGTAEVERYDARLAEQATRIPRATVLALKKAYGARLFIVYAPPTGLQTEEPVETELRGLCAEQGVGFLSVREPLARDRAEHHRLNRGFHNTAPGVGHFNATGHRIIGEEIWRYLRARSSSATPR